MSFNYILGIKMNDFSKMIGIIFIFSSGILCGYLGMDYNNYDKRNTQVCEEYKEFRAEEEYKFDLLQRLDHCEYDLHHITSCDIIKINYTEFKENHWTHPLINGYDEYSLEMINNTHGWLCID